MSVFLLVSALFAGACSAMLLSYEWLWKRGQARVREGALRRLGTVDAEGRKAGVVSTFLSKAPFGPLLARRENQRRKVSFERDLPALLEVIALGMQAGMGFDQAFALYTERFGTPLARCCKESLDVWRKGLKTRDEGMRQLAEQVGTPSFRHFCSSALRALRFGAPMTQLLLDLAREARKEYRAARQELVAKAPVKMLLPTGVLILPAMLLLVMGPIMLDLMRKMG
ncbi:MAG: type II secretion system F family protein [Coriobacteriales bacterium]|jgi:tight adherence protein C|nr:type II secretion system F family protein [Coriobacteriales bacterium]